MIPDSVRQYQLRSYCCCYQTLTVDYPQGVKVQLRALHGTVGDQLVLIIEVVIKLRLFVSTKVKLLEDEYIATTGEIEIKEEHAWEALKRGNIGSAYRWPIVSAIRFSPQVESLGLDLRIELRKTTKEALQDMPSGDSSQVRCINSSGVDNRIACGGNY